MERRFAVSDERIKIVQLRVYREMILWTVLVGVALAISPKRRFGNAYQVIVEMPGGPDSFAAAYLLLAVVLAYALHRKNDKVMAWALFAGGMINWMLGIFLLLGALFGPTGVLGAPFALYIGRHMFIHSALFSGRKKR